MGEFLSTPIKDKFSEDGENEIVNTQINLAQVWSMWYARLEKENGGFSHIRSK
jgi:hypothetical protein